MKNVITVIVSDYDWTMSKGDILSYALLEAKKISAKSPRPLQGDDRVEMKILISFVEKSDRILQHEVEVRY